MKIEVLVSTYNDGFDKIKFNPEFDYLVVHQVSSEYKDKYNAKYESLATTNSKIRYIQCVNEKGLSKSRNVALSYAKGEYVWIMDDDVVILDGAYNKLLSTIEYLDKNISMILLNYTSNEDIREAFNRNNNHTYVLNSYNSFHVSSINMLIKRDVKDFNLFDESFGLGGQFPSGEEYIFLTDLIKKGKLVYQSDVVSSKHPPDSSGFDFYSSPLKVIAKLMMFNRVFGYLGPLFFVAFVTKNLPYLIKCRSVILFFRNLFNGLIFSDKCRNEN